MHLSTLLAFAALEAALCFVPGPAVMTVVAASLRRGTRSGLASAGGVLTANTCYFAVSAAGVVSAIVASHAVFVILKWGGAAFLAYLGFRALFARPAAASTGAPDALPTRDISRGWSTGLITQLANPKAVIFFAALLPQFIDEKGSVIFQVAILGLVSAAIEFGVLALYALSADTMRRAVRDSRRTIWLERIGGALMLGVAARVAATAR